MRKNVLLLIFSLLLSGNLLSGNLEVARGNLFFASGFAMALSASIVVISALLIIENYDAESNLGADQEVSELKQKEVSEALEPAYLATSVAAIEFMTAVGIFISNKAQRDKSSVLLSGFYFMPWLLNAVAQVIQISALRSACDSKTQCWAQYTCGRSVCQGKIFNAAYKAWASLKAFSIIPPMWAVSTCGCFQFYLRVD